MQEVELNISKTEIELKDEVSREEWFGAEKLCA
jgi:hypothetical protein